MTITTDSPIYQKAFEQYLRRGTPMEISLKAMTARRETTASHSTTLYIWRTAGDNKVRPSHASNEGKIFRWDSPPPTGNPGDAINCRCTAEPYVSPFLPNDPTNNDPPLDPVYPELLLIPFLRIPRLIAAWRAWLLARRASREWQLSKNKSSEKWANQIEQGNWTPEKITDTIKFGIPHKAIDKKTGELATRYQLGNRFVVRIDKTGDIIQVSRPNMKPEVFK
jgi:SPP1 gp7 family putative phage head morphogenesis protein